MCSANRLINQSAVTTKRLQSLFMGRTSVCLTVVSALLHHRNVICLDTFPRECSPPPPPTNNPFSQPHGFKCEAGGIDVFVSGTPPPKNKKTKQKHSVYVHGVCFYQVQSCLWNVFWHVSPHWLTNKHRQATETLNMQIFDEICIETSAQNCAVMTI